MKWSMRRHIYLLSRYSRYQLSHYIISYTRKREGVEVRYYYNYLTADWLFADPRSRIAPCWRRIARVCSSGDDSWTIPRSDSGRPAVCPPFPAPRDPKSPSARNDVYRHRVPPEHQSIAIFFFLHLESKTPRDRHLGVCPIDKLERNFPCFNV